MTELVVLVSRHARERALERAGIGVTLVALEVRRALEEGRMAVNEPAWLGWGRRRRADRNRRGSSKGGHSRWVWPPEETRAYLVAKKKDRWVVVTVVVAREDAAELAA